MRLSTLLVFSVLCLGTVRANANEVNVPPSALSFWAEYQCCTFDVAYNAATETLSTTAAFGTGSAPARMLQGLAANDIVGMFTLSAHVNHSGEVTGGSYSWMASIPSLGIVAPEVLMSGSILGSMSHADYSSALGASVDMLSPTLTALVSTPNFAVFSFSTTMPCFCAVAPNDFWWQSDQLYHVIQPDIFVYHSVPIPVPEPQSLLLIGFGLIALLVKFGFDRSYKH